MTFSYFVHKHFFAMRSLSRNPAALMRAGQSSDAGKEPGSQPSTFL
jgi:hypothetical protein